MHSNNDNPYYDPNWEKMHDFHAAERDRAGEKCSELVSAGKMDTDAYRESSARREKHAAACRDYLRAQHKTVLDYAKWVFGNFPISDDYRTGIPVPQLDLTTLRTIEDVNEAWERVQGMVTSAAEKKLGSMPVGQPEGMTAFADASALTCTWRQFTSKDLRGKIWHDANVRTLVIVDEQDDGWHVCFVSSRHGASVTNTIEHLATAIFREGCTFAEQTAKRPGWVARLLGQEKSVSIDPAQFHFYEHTPAGTYSGLGETFSQVAMKFEDGEYRHPSWDRYPVVPLAIQSAFDPAEATSPTEKPTLFRTN